MYETIQSLAIMCSFVQVDATDGDAGANGQVIFSFVKPSPYFAINELTGEITALSSFDYEQRRSYTLTIQARDNSTTSPLTSTARFVANITDVNDNAPFYSLFPSSKVFSESTSLGTEIARVSADDRDFGDNGAVSIHFIRKTIFSSCRCTNFPEDKLN